MKTKVCTKCGKEKPVTEYYKDRNVKKDGLVSACKKCKKQGQDAHNEKTFTLEHLKQINKYKENREIDKQLENTDKKRCTKCGNIKPRNHFDKSKQGKYSLNEWCKKCRYKYSDREKLHAYDKKYKKEHKEEQRQQRKTYQNKNKDRLAKKRTEKYFKLKTDNHKQLLDKAKRYRVKNEDKIYKDQKRMRDNLEDGYIKNMLRHKTGLSNSDIPEGLIELQRSSVKLYRAIKSLCS